MSLNSYIMLSAYHDELCFFHIMSLNSYIMLSSYHDELCWFHIMSLCSYNMSSSCHDELCLFHIMTLNSYNMLSSYHDELCFFLIMSFGSCITLPNNIIILCCHHIMTSCDSFILCCWVTMLYWMFGTDLTFGTNGLQSTKFYFRLRPFRFSVTSVFCSFDSSPAILQSEELADLV